MITPSSPRFDPRVLPPRRTVPADAIDRGCGPRLMCVTHVVPYPARAGNATRIHHLLRALAASGWDVLVVVCPFETPNVAQINDLAAVYPKVVIAERGGTLWHRVDDHVDILEALRGRTGAGIDLLLPRDGSHADELSRAFCPDELARLVWHLDAAWRPDVALAEYAFMARTFPLLRPDALKVVDTIDVFSTKAAKVESHGIVDQFAIGPGEEAALLRGADVVIGIQQDETELLCRLAPGSVAVTAGVDFPIRSHPTPAGAPHVLLVGDDNPMNAQGLHAFVHDAWPLVRAAVPGAELRVIGAVGNTLDAPPAGVCVLGPVDDLDPEYAACRVAINPAAAGTGLKIKSVEALAHRRPLVTWPAGVDGIDPIGRARIDVATDWPDFASHVVRALREPRTDAPIAPEDPLTSLLSAETVYRPLHQVLRAAIDRPSLAPRTRSRSRRILTLLARHGDERYADAPAQLRRLFADQLPHVQHDVIVIDNRLPAGTHPSPGRPDDELIGGSNDAGEFSAWDDGITHAGTRLDGYDLVNLATSAFRQLYVRYLDRIDERVLRLIDGRQVAVGHIDRHLQPVSVLGYGAQSWLRSSFLLVPPATLRHLASLVSIRDRSALFTGDHRSPFRADAPISTRYQEYIGAWLTGDGTGQGTAWHSRFELTDSTLPRFQHKTLAIINEQMLTLRLRAGGCAVVDATWLATQATMLGGAPLGPIPPWPEQLAGRDTDAVPLRHP